MSKVLGFTGIDDFFPGGSIYANPKEPSLLLSLGRHVDVYFPPQKRSRISAPLERSQINGPFLFGGEWFEAEKKLQTSIEDLPDECLFEIFRRLPGGQERSSCACVSKRWLWLLGYICKDEICSNKKTSYESDVNGEEADVEELGGGGYLSRDLEGKKANDVRLAAIAVGTASRGGLGKLSIRGDNSGCAVTNVGLKAVARGCPSLKALSLWSVTTIDDEGLIEIASGCPQLKKLDLCYCPTISDKALIAVAKNCPNLTELSIESCPRIGNEGLQAVGQFSTSLRSLSIKNCTCVGDQGIASLFSSASFSLTKVKLEALPISDLSLAVIGHYGKAVTDLAFKFLPNVSEKGFWLMGNGHGLQKLNSLSIASCQGVTDIGLDALGRGCPNLKHLYLCKSAFLSDYGLASFSKAALSLESLKLEECDRITQLGIFGVIFNCCAELKALALTSCFGIKDQNLVLPSVSPCQSLQSLSIRNCPGFGDATMALLGKLCPQLQYVELSKLEGVTDAGFLPVLLNSEAGLVKVNLSHCINLTDKVVSSIANKHGLTLEVLNLDGCKKVSDVSLMAIAENCPLIWDLDVSESAITDAGVTALAGGGMFHLQILSLSGCSLVSNKSLPALRNLGETLLGLNIRNCKAINGRTIGKLVERLWRCDILS
ncbi:EIN3-binding F-box protein 1-like [Prosopis cineraria]|uniref:EIN3-binding F-box protein 1-like n=1 Tax=Prosopis cineraria TaxID=364024 RepID=UPI00240FE0D1|nr:EIN3-binding F-box protein 1-like [Prosopis cineraria]